MINQEIKEARAKLHELIVSCSSDSCQLPLKSNGKYFVKMQTYIVSIQELDKLYASYHLPYFKHIRVISACVSILTKLSRLEPFKKTKEFIQRWCLPQSHGAALNHYSNFELTDHTSTIRQSLTSDVEDVNEEQRLAMLNLEYKSLCLSYQFVS
ncbi:hypothetical protein Ssed_2501 [Shewanella sediminis HAW-EB3]|uniref:Uncharacterized protein n=1 Tax=Shewanella sediminis (strain HAW-EB3) TaxID=425104 RepID=A8FW87_SHESH|nr:hypothetical protein Ssed_2501 [Shewanella sediminis HAW-EB3]